MPITRKAFATWVTAHKKHSWDHQLFYLFLFQFLLIEKFVRYISLPWGSLGKQWSDNPFLGSFEPCWWYSTAGTSMSLRNGSYIGDSSLPEWNPIGCNRQLISATKLLVLDGKHIFSTLAHSLTWASYLKKNVLMPWAPGSEDWNKNPLSWGWCWRGSIMGVSHCPGFLKPASHTLCFKEKVFSSMPVCRPKFESFRCLCISLH